MSEILCIMLCLLLLAACLAHVKTKTKATCDDRRRRVTPTPIIANLLSIRFLYRPEYHITVTSELQAQ